MRNGYTANNILDENGNPTGGSVIGVGITIEWQDGPLGRGDDRREPNGAFVEDVISACVERLDFYQRSKFACADNIDAIYHLEMALKHLKDRTKDREERNVEGLHEA